MDEKPFIFNPEGRCVGCRDRIFEGFQFRMDNEGKWLVCPRCGKKQRPNDKLVRTTNKEPEK
jgi:hypothetical protein